MITSWKLGRIAGIDCYVHPSILLVLAFSPVVEWGILGVLLIVAAFACVLFHELGHALMARRFGIETRDITLYPIGGIARLERLPRAPGAELAIALAGPAVNIAIAAGLGLLALTGLLDISPVIAFLGVNLLLINGVLALFNLIPAFPMDGGRVLRAVLSGWMGRVRATAVAATIGRGLALMFGVYSLALALTDFTMSHWMQVFLAAFIYFAAGNELRAVTAEQQRREESQGIWTAPPGFHWVNQGNGLWRLAPITVPTGSRPSSSWR